MPKPCSTGNKRQSLGIELEALNVQIADKFGAPEIISIWLRHFRVCMEVSVFGGVRFLTSRGGGKFV